MLIEWVSAEVGGGSVYVSEMAEGYEIRRIGADFYAQRTFADCDNIGPLPDFKSAEDIILKIGLALVEFEEKLWRVSAAVTMRDALPALLDSTANQLEDNPS